MTNVFTEISKSIEKHLNNFVQFQKTTSKLISKEEYESKEQIEYVNSVLEFGETMETIVLYIKSLDLSQKQINEKMKSISEQYSKFVQKDSYDQDKIRNQDEFNEIVTYLYR